jgi:hypothetical protein
MNWTGTDDSAIKLEASPTSTDYDLSASDQESDDSAASEVRSLSEISEQHEQLPSDSGIPAEEVQPEESQIEDMFVFTSSASKKSKKGKVNLRGISWLAKDALSEETEIASKWKPEYSCQPYLINTSAGVRFEAEECSSMNVRDRFRVTSAWDLIWLQRSHSATRLSETQYFYHILGNSVVGLINSVAAAMHMTAFSNNLYRTPNWRKTLRIRHSWCSF